jgi:AAA domain
LRSKWVVCEAGGREHIWIDTNSDLQEQVKGQVMWVDEAGFLSVRQMVELQEFALQHNCRLIVTRDTKQHYSVEWGDALRILERSGVIAQAVLTKIYRQRIPGLREAIEDLSKGRTGEGFDKLDKFEVIHEITNDARRLAAIAEKQIEALTARKSSLIVAPTQDPDNVGVNQARIFASRSSSSA